MTPGHGYKSTRDNCPGYLHLPLLTFGVIKRSCWVDPFGHGGGAYRLDRRCVVAPVFRDWSSWLSLALTYFGQEGLRRDISLRGTLFPWLETAEGDDTSVLRLILAQCPAVIVDRVEV